MIISVSRRTDIPAYFSDWFGEMLNKKSVLVKNPFNSKQVTNISLVPEDVTAFVFWTRNSDPFLPVLEKIFKHSYPFYFLFTITPYNKPLEQNSLSSEVQTTIFKRLARLIGREKIVWRYDPIILSNKTDFNYHLNHFKDLADKLHQYTNEVKVSFLDYYKKTDRNLKPLRDNHWIFKKNPPQKPGFDIFLNKLITIAHERELKISSCADLIIPGHIIQAEGCININKINTLSNLNIQYKKDKNQRPACLCHQSKDIGSYNTCRHGCLYCYAC